ncbi:hypothetical protein P168DRAFT_329198 [Aspergillus campestris IBT 28561]|uniref:Uncharacterized protein n=1 Tax=Aspergillus campestris (strain IBT 28561) TaxID=1392248 RepID=A0A2I1CX95_ASPC2|nr:uncharacterized protein P168DRAFT_329198 [Aspergillus campestris IBT 28561]PKY02246.1 hypothetical protein P168DRAFT_329198 [Aspergillus campestris IBT 28561]
MAGKIFGRTPGSLSAPIAAFSMAVILCSYCVSSINTARREAQIPPGSVDTRHKQPTSDKAGTPSWVQKALEESREAEKRGGSK